MLAQPLSADAELQLIGSDNSWSACYAKLATEK